ncbi:MAG: citryl-CoA lyase [Vicinamibacterales bacterium]
MNDDRSTPDRGTGGKTRRSRGRGPEEWPTSITRIAPNEIEIRGYPVDELMGRLGYGEAVYLLLRGELPTPSIGKLFSAVLVSSLDHGVTPPSTLAARHVAASGSTLSSAVAAGVLAFGSYHGGDIEACMRCLQEGLSLHRTGMSYEEVARTLLEKHCGSGPAPPGFGHRVHTRDPRAARLMQLAHELDLDGEHCRLLRVVERVLNEMPGRPQQIIPLNIDGAIAAVCGDLGFGPEIGNGLFIISRVPGLLAHTVEEKSRHSHVRRIDPNDAYYDGPGRRRLPETRK